MAHLYRWAVFILICQSLTLRILSLLLFKIAIMKQILKLSSILLISSIFSISCGSSSKSKSSAVESKPAKSAIETKVKSCKKYDGLFPVYQDTTNGSTYIIVKKEQLEKDFIYFSYTADGVVAAGHFRGSFRDNRLFTIKKYFDRIEFVIKNTGYYFDSSNPISKSAQANISQAIIVNQKILAEDAKKGEYLLDANSIFLTESLSQIKPSPSPGSRGFSLGGLSKDKTKYVSLKNYEKNTDVVVEYVYDNPAPIAGGGKEVADERAVSIFIQHSLIEAPVNTFKPRFDDPRLGYFSEQIEDMTTTKAVAYKDLIHRWHLVKKDSTAALSEPVEPIVWWIENTTPKEFRATIKEAGEKWNIAFESAGFKNAVVINEQPDTADWDAGDIRYNVLRWTSSPQPPFGGYGPSFVDPRTGQILGADIMLEYIFVTNRIKQEQLFDAGKSAESFSKNGFSNFCDAGHHLHASTLFGASALQANGISDVESREYIKQSLYYLVLHEMGHTLGLNHNMKASQMLKPALLNNKELTRKIGLTASVMDYPAVNVALDKSKQGDYFTTRPGPYDLWAIQFGYSQGNGTEEEENKRLMDLLSLSTDTLLIFGNDADDMRGIGRGIDPRINVNDMSGDALTFASDRMVLANIIISGLKLKYSKVGESYHELRQAFNIAQGEYFNQLSVVSRYVGGVYVDRAFVGQKDATKPLIPVPMAEQKRAMTILTNYAFSKDAFKNQFELAPYLQTQRRGFNFFGSNEDPKIHDKIIGNQEALLAHLLNNTVLKRMSDTRMYGNTYSVMAMMTDLTNACFRGDAGNVNSFRQNLQHAYLERLISIIESPYYDGISQSAALYQIKEIEKIAMGSGANAETNAHYMAIRFKINKALDKK